ncbi:MAG: FAD-dependent thymidylate synthase [Candidatus Omnitrophica bacterium]|nr:FAD-dependent thymidylate synthase [Candidatus Omnitrophota bacterium]
MSDVASLSITPEPIVRLENYFQQPYNLSIATARTCYSSQVISASDVDRDEKARAQRDRIAESIYRAGHHTTIQHPTFQFVLERVSRQFIWSFLHSHPFYNSEQVSQRFVEVKPGNVTVPPLGEEARAVYLETVRLQMGAYHRLIELVEPAVTAEYRRLFPSRDPSEKRWAGSIHKRCQEVARYALPVATHAHLYHTVSGITLHRYWRLCEELDAPLEQRLVVQKMVEEVRRVDPQFMELAGEPIPLERTLEYQAFEMLHRPLSNGTAARNGAGQAGRAFLDEFDQELGGLASKLVDYKVQGQATMAQAVRSVLGLPKDGLSDSQAIGLVLNPASNPYLSDTLTLTTVSKLTRAMVHPHFTFKKKLSHTADSQDQRHRMVPASRPVLASHFTADRPDYLVPALIAATPAARDCYDELMRVTWEAIRRLLELDTPMEFALYLLPNAFPIRFEESGDLLHFHHKWVQRLCYTAQEEIWNTCREEVLQVAERFPDIGRYLGAPCTLRSQAKVAPYCPEGDRFCGVPVWKLDVEDYRRLI